MTSKSARPAAKKLLVGLIGSGIQRSLTPAMHEAEARAQGLALHYQLIDLEAAGCGVEALPTLVSAARIMGFAGLNITYPCKQAVIPLLDGVHEAPELSDLKTPPPPVPSPNVPAKSLLESSGSIASASPVSLQATR